MALKLSWIKVVLVTLLIGFMAFEGYVVLVQRHGDLPLPPLFGNFEKVRTTLQAAPPKEEFSFAVLGDPRGGNGIFEEIVKKLRVASPDFVVLLGDCSKATEGRHRYFRAQCATGCAMSCPMFYVVGNQDIDPEHFPLSRFEALYGPSLFSFEFQDCLFIGLRNPGDASSNRESTDFLTSFLDRETDKYRRIFVFMHVPPPLPGFDSKKFRAPEELKALFQQLKVDHVFTGHYHGYARTQLGDTTYLITGGGGSPLEHGREDIGQFYHGIVVGVGPDHVSERIVMVPPRLGWDEELEQFAIAGAYPIMANNIVTTCLLNLGLLLALMGVMHRVRVRDWWSPTS
jgi:predicted phosphodiesterase